MNITFPISDVNYCSTFSTQCFGNISRDVLGVVFCQFDLSVLLNLPAHWQPHVRLDRISTTYGVCFETMQGYNCESLYSFIEARCWEIHVYPC